MRRWRNLLWRIRRYLAGKPYRLTDEEWAELFDREHARTMARMRKFVESEFFKSHDSER